MRRISSPGRRKVGFRQIAPRCARPQDPEDTIEDTPVVYAGDAAWFVREHRLDDAPFVVTELIAHDSKLHFGGLNHGLATGLNVSDQTPDLVASQTFAPLFRFQNTVRSGTLIFITGTALALGAGG